MGGEEWGRVGAQTFLRAREMGVRRAGWVVRELLNWTILLSLQVGMCVKDGNIAYSLRSSSLEGLSLHLSYNRPSLFLLRHVSSPFPGIAAALSSTCRGYVSLWASVSSKRTGPGTLFCSSALNSIQSVFGHDGIFDD